MIVRMKFYSVGNNDFEKEKEGYTLLFAADTRAKVTESIPSYFYEKEWYGEFLENIKDILEDIPRNESGYGSVLLIECLDEVNLKLLAIWINEIMCKLFVNVAISIKNCYSFKLQDKLQDKIYGRPADCFEHCYVFKYGTYNYNKILNNIRRTTNLCDDIEECLDSSVYIFNNNEYKTFINEMDIKDKHHMYYIGDFKDIDNTYSINESFTGNMYKCLENAGKCMSKFKGTFNFILVIECPDSMSLLAYKRLVHSIAYFIYKYNVSIIVACPEIYTERFERCIASYWYC